MKLSVQLVVWNGEKYLPALINSVIHQNFKDFELLILDNASSDSSREVLKDLLNGTNVKYSLFSENNNIGFAGGHNYLFKKSDCEYVALVNQDMVLTSNAFEDLVNFLEKHPNTASVAPLLLRLQNGYKVNIVDSAGLVVYRNRRIADLLSGEDARALNLQNSEQEVFGVSGAFAVFDRKKINCVNDNQELFDDKYFAYQEDFDLAWRLRAAGFDSYVLHQVLSYHERSVRSITGSGAKQVVENKQKQPFSIRYYSYRNHLMTLIKNESLQGVGVDFLPILWYELKKFIYNLLFDTAVLKGIGEVINNWTNLTKKRRFVQSQCRQPKFIRKWVV